MLVWRIWRSTGKGGSRMPRSEVEMSLALTLGTGVPSLMNIPASRVPIRAAAPNDLSSLGTSTARAATAASEMQTKKTTKRAFIVFLLLVVVCFSRRILGRFPALQKCAGTASLFGSHPFISLSSSGVI